jgi:transcriptional regulator with XRE-family HTH domain
VASPPRQHTRARSRRPIEAAEITHLEALGACLAAVRRDRGVTQAVLAEAAELSTSGIRRIEAGTRRTRRSTLDGIAAALDEPELADELARLAGPALAPESPYAERIARVPGGTAAAELVGIGRRGERRSARSTTFSASLIGSRGSPRLLALQELGRLRAGATAQLSSVATGRRPALSLGAGPTLSRAYRAPALSGGF